MDRLFSLIEIVFQDLRFALRMLAKSPGFTAVAVLSIALGIGANTAIFSLIDAVMWRTLPVKDPKNLLSVVTNRDQDVNTSVSYREYRAMREGSRLVELAAYSPVRVSISVDGNVEPEVDAQMVSGNYFSLLGVRPIAGRAIGLDDDRVPNGHPVVMISYTYWSRRFGLTASAIGVAFRSSVRRSRLSESRRQSFLERKSA